MNKLPRFDGTNNKAVIEAMRHMISVDLCGNKDIEVGYKNAIALVEDTYSEKDMTEFFPLIMELGYSKLSTAELFIAMMPEPDRKNTPKNYTCNTCGKEKSITTNHFQTMGKCCTVASRFIADGLVCKDKFIVGEEKRRLRSLELPPTKLVANQQIKETREVDGIEVVWSLRHDDSCGNGHNSFYTSLDMLNEIDDGYEVLENETALRKVFPEHFKVKDFNGLDTEGKSYVSNLLFTFRDREDMSLEIGEPTRWDTLIAFKGFPISYVPKSADTISFIQQYKKGQGIVIEKIEEEGKGVAGVYQYEPRFTFKHDGHNPTWAFTMFASEMEAEEFREAIYHHNPYIKKKPTAFNPAITPEAKAVKETTERYSCTLADLRDKVFVEKLLVRDLTELKVALEELGLTY